VLDVGCGAGRFCRIAADRGARVSGLDATPALVEIARERIPDGHFRVGDMEELPWADDSFNVVNGCNSFFIPADIVHALAEARPVVRPGALVAMTVFGRPDHCQSMAMFEAIGGLVSATPAADGTQAGQAVHEEGALEALAMQAGLGASGKAYSRRAPLLHRVAWPALHPDFLLPGLERDQSPCNPECSIDGSIPTALRVFRKANRPRNPD